MEDASTVSNAIQGDCIPSVNNRPPFLYSREVASDANLADGALATRYRYYSRLDPRSESTLIMPSHILPANFFSIISFDDIGKQGSLVTIFSIWNTMMGTALLAIPWAFNQAGLVLGTLLILFVGLLAFYTAFRVVDTTAMAAKGALHKNIEFSDVCRYHLGSLGDGLAVVFSLISLVGATVVYWVLMSNFLFYTGTCIYSAVYESDSPWSIIDTNFSLSCDVSCAPSASNGSAIPTDHSVFHKAWDLKHTVPFYLVLLIFPFLNFESPTFFTKFNGLGTISVFYLLIFVSMKLYKCGVHIDPSFSTSGIEMFKSTFPSLTGTLALSYFLHNCVVTVMKNQRNPDNNVRDLGIAYGLVIMTYSLIALLFYIAFPLHKDCIADNFLNNYGVGDLLSAIARVFLLFQMLTVYPLLAYLIRIQVFYRFFEDVYPSVWHVMGLNTLVISAGILFAIFFPSVGSILRFVGSVSGLVYVFTLPCLVHMKRLKAEGRLSRFSMIFHCAIIVIGVVNLLAQFIPLS